MKEYDVFICHASEDKNKIVRELVINLKKYNLKIWYDEFSISLGDNISRSIDKGLSKSQYGIVILSPDFIKKPWPEFEIQGLLTKEFNNRNIIIPIWHNITKDELLAYSPYIAGKKAIDSSNHSINVVTEKVIEVVKPELLTKILRRKTWNLSRIGQKIEWTNGKEIKESSIRHKKLPIELVNRIRLFRIVLFEANPLSMKDWLDGFKRESHPSIEIQIWEKIASIYSEYCYEFKINDIDRKKEIYSVLLQISFGTDIYKLMDIFPDFDNNKIQLLMDMYYRNKPFFEVESRIVYEDNGSVPDWIDKESFDDIDYRKVKNIF